MKKLLRPLGTALVLALLAAGVYAASAEDSLISLSYLRDTFFPKAVQAGEEAGGKLLQETYDSAKAQLDAAAAGGASAGGGGLYSDSLQRRVWADGQTISLPTGGSFLMLEGAAAVSHSGAVIDVTTGEETPSGGALTANHRYLVGEDTTASVNIRSGQAALGVQGGYVLTEGKSQHTPFFDVSQSDWFYSQVAYVYEKGLVNGVDAGHFAPYLTMTRAMLMTVLHRQAGSPAAGPDAPKFTDVTSASWCYQPVSWGAAQGITSGMGDGSFNPDGQITREQAVVMMYNYATNYLKADTGDKDDLSRFQDAGQVSGWARPAMGWAVRQGILNGVDHGSFLTIDPQRSATRAEMATMLRTFCEKIL